MYRVAPRAVNHVPQKRFRKDLPRAHAKGHAKGAKARQLIRAPVAFTTFAHLSRSAAISFTISCGVPVCTSTP